MLSSTLSWTFTVVFTLTSVYSLVRLAELVRGKDRTGSRLAELSHLLMSLAMIAMAWGATGGPSSPSGLLQIVVFGLVGVWALARLSVPVGDHRRAEQGYHLAANAAMVWMVAAMPRLMGGTPAHHDVAGADMSGMDTAGMDTAGMDPAGMDIVGAQVAPAPPATPGWVVAVSTAFVVLLLAGAVLWAVRIARPDTAAGCDGEPADGGASGASGGSVVAVALAPARTRSTGTRLDAGCHLVMALGTAAMLLTML